MAVKAAQNFLKIVISVESGTKGYNPPMKPHPLLLITLTLILLLTSCVPIPAIPPDTPALPS